MRGALRMTKPVNKLEHWTWTEVLHRNGCHEISERAGHWGWLEQSKVQPIGADFVSEKESSSFQEKKRLLPARQQQGPQKRFAYYGPMTYLSKAFVQAIFVEDDEPLHKFAACGEAGEREFQWS